MTNSSLGLGIRFCPTDEELITHFLMNMIKDQRLPWGADRLIIERDIYGEKGTPWILFGDDNDVPWQTVVDSLGKVVNQQSLVYVLTRLSSVGKKEGDKNKIRVAGCGQWHGNTAAEPIKKTSTGEVIGKKRTFTFKSKEEETRGQWSMHEYFVDGNCFKGGLESLDTSLVLCRIKRDNSKSSKGGKLLVSCKFDDKVKRDVIEGSRGQEESGSNKKLKRNIADQELVLVTNETAGLINVDDSTFKGTNCMDTVLSNDQDDTELCYYADELLSLLDESPPEIDGEQTEGFQHLTSDAGSMHEGGKAENDEFPRDSNMTTNHTDGRVDDDDAFGVIGSYEYSHDLIENLVSEDVDSIPLDYDMRSMWEQYYRNPSSFFDSGVLGAH